MSHSRCPPKRGRARKGVTGDRRSLKVRRLLLRKGKKLEPTQRFLIKQWLKQHPELEEVYRYKQALHVFYDVRGYHRADKALTKLTDKTASSSLPEIKTLRKTLIKWRQAILAYFRTGLTNARTEGFNGVAKLVKRRLTGIGALKTTG